MSEEPCFDIQVINLKSRPERWEHFCEVCPFSEYNRFNAVDGRNLHSENAVVKIKLRPIEGQHRVLGEIGCSLSHYMLWRYVREQNRAVLILEDDVLFNDDSVVFFNKAYKQLCSDKLRQLGWALAFVGGQWTPKYGIGSDSKFPFHFNKDIAPCYAKMPDSDILYNRNKVGQSGWRSPMYRCTGGYFISSEGAKILIKLADRDPMFLNIPIDCWLLGIEARFQSIRFLDVFPHPTYQAPFNIGIGDWSAYATGPEIVTDKRLQNSDVLRGKREKIILQKVPKVKEY